MNRKVYHTHPSNFLLRKLVQREESQTLVGKSPKAFQRLPRVSFPLEAQKVMALGT